MVASVSAMYRYPVKSMLGEALRECVVGMKGLVGDRAYALIDSADGSIASAKAPRKWGSMLAMSARYLVEPCVSEPSPPIEIALADGRVIWSDDPSVDDVLSDALDRNVHLTQEHNPNAAYEFTPNIGLANNVPSQEVIDALATRAAKGRSRLSLAEMPDGTFYDAAMLHVLTTSTMDELRRLAPGADVDARRFRANLVFETDSLGFAEDDWVSKTITVGEVMLMQVDMLTMRCVMTSLAQRGLTADREVMQAIAKHNRKEVPGMGIWACAGVYASVAKEGLVCVGDKVGV